MDPTSSKDALSLIAKVIALGKRATNVQYEEALVAAREEIIKYKEQNVGLRERLLELKESSKFQIEKGHSWIVNSDDPGGPKYCPSCYSAEKRLTPLAAKTCHRCKINVR